ncbi:MAG: hypothetical protein R3C53_16380 [Pirellulaceae bacterium]
MPHSLHNLRLSRACLRWLVLVWMIVCQFPLPMAHAHDAQPGQDSYSNDQLGEHLARYHTGHSLDPDAVHWHVVFVWDMVCGGGNDSQIAVSVCHTSLGIADVSPCESTSLIEMAPTPTTFALAENASRDERPTVRGLAVECTSFLQTYAGKTSLQLTCAILC